MPLLLQTIRDGSQAPSLLSQSMPKGHYDIPESQNSASGWQWVVNAIYLPIDTGVDTQIPKFRIQILHFTLNMTSPKQYRKKHASAARLHIIFAEGPQRSLVSFCVTLATSIMGRTLGAFFANLLNMGEAPRTLSEDDFAKWYSTLKPPQATIVGEALPAGVPTMASRYGVFGSKALMTGVPGDENNNTKRLCGCLNRGQPHLVKRQVSAKSSLTLLQSSSKDQKRLEYLL